MFNILKKRLKEQRGFTLVELLAVIVILGIIAAIAVPSIGNLIEKSKIDGVKADAISLLNAARLYEANGGTIVDGTTGLAEIEQYVDSSTKLSDAKFSKDSTTGDLLITATSADPALTFSAASVGDINAATDVKAGESIPAAAPTPPAGG